jgi:hypothetical protein
VKSWNCWSNDRCGETGWSVETVVEIVVKTGGDGDWKWQRRTPVFPTVPLRQERLGVAVGGSGLP